MKVLAIETSCDETSIAVVDFQSLNNCTILAEQILSQNEIHVEYGGVVPELAAREHSKNLPILLDQTLGDLNLNLSDFDALAVTIGPGLKGCLLTGLGFAQGLSLASGVRLLGVNHIEGHLLAAFLNNPKLTFPYLALLVSGGHTQIVLVENLGKYQILSETIDDAAGEAFDKSAHLLGFAYPGGPQLAKLADTVNTDLYTLPIVMKGQTNFSFSGLKTAISLLVKEHQPITPEIQANLAHSIQRSIVENLIFKLKKVKKQTGIERLVVTGGVAANKYLRSAVSKLAEEVYYPDFKHCMDNAGMIGLVAAARLDADLPAYPTTNVYSRIPDYSGLQK